jgi:hypothetical protein
MKKIILIIFLSGLSVLFNCCDPDAPDNHVKIIVLDDFDPDFTNPPFDDRVNILDYSGTLISQMTFSDFNIAGTYGGHRELSASRDGNYFAVGQYITNPGLTKYNMSGNLVFQVRGAVHASCFYQSRIYALTTSGIIFGDESFVVDGNGNIIARSSLSGFDVVVDDLHHWVWFVGENVIRLDLDLNPLMTVDPIIYLANSVDSDSYGNAWVCERDHPQIHESLNRVLKIAADGAILVTITDIAQPFCVRVDKSNQNIWVGHGNGISKFDPSGNLYLTVTGFTGWSLEIDPNDQSVWVGTYQDVRHYSSTGTLIDIFTTNFSPSDHKFVALAVQ